MDVIMAQVDNIRLAQSYSIPVWVVNSENVPLVHVRSDYIFDTWITLTLVEPEEQLFALEGMANAFSEIDLSQVKPVVTEALVFMEYVALSLLGRRQELMERYVEQSDRDRILLHGPEDRDEILPLHGLELLQGLQALLFVLGKDHLDDDLEPVLEVEHPLGPAESDPFGPELDRLLGVLGRVGVGAHFQSSDSICPLHEFAELAGEFRFDGGHLAQEHLSGGAV